MSTHTPVYRPGGDQDSPGDETKPIPLHVDVLGEKIIENAGPGNENPRNFREAWGIVKGHLLKICISPTGILADGLDAVRSVVQGVKKFIMGTAEWPEAVATRIRRVTNEATQEENKRQKLLLEGSKPPPALPAPTPPTSLPAPKPVAALPTGPRIDHVALAKAMSELQSVIDEIRAEGGVVEIRMRDDGTCVVILVRPGAEAYAHELGSFLLDEAADHPALGEGQPPEDPDKPHGDLPALEGPTPPRGKLPSGPSSDPKKPRKPGQPKK